MSAAPVVVPWHRPPGGPAAAVLKEENKKTSQLINMPLLGGGGAEEANLGMAGRLLSPRGEDGGLGRMDIQERPLGGA